MAVMFIGEALSEAPLPESLNVTLTDVGARTRTASGACVAQVNRPALRTLTVTWKGLKAEEAAPLLGELSRESFLLKYPDPLTGAYRQARFFCTRREARVEYALQGAPALEFLRAVCEEV